MNSQLSSINPISSLINLGLDIATNKITPEEAEGVPHHMMSFLDPSTSSYNVHLFRKSCLETIEVSIYVPFKKKVCLSQGNASKG